MRINFGHTRWLAVGGYILMAIFLVAIGYTLVAANPVFAQVGYCAPGTTACPSGCTLGVNCTSCWTAPTCTIAGQTAATCGSCQCPAGQIVCGSACQAPASNASCAGLNRSVNTCTGACGGCNSGFVEDPANPGGACIATPTPAYINFNNPGELRTTNALRVIGTAAGVGDIYLNSGKAIRVDGSGTTILNIGNWGTGATNVSVNVLGTVTATQYCIGASCITSWPVGGGGGGDLTGSGTAGQLAFFTGATALGSDGNLVWNNTEKRLLIGVGTFPAGAPSGSTLVGGNLYSNTLYSRSTGADNIWIGDANDTAQVPGSLTVTGTISGGTITIRGSGVPSAGPACAEGEVLKLTGGVWVCAADSIGVPGAAFDPCTSNIVRGLSAVAPSGDANGYVSANSTYCAPVGGGSHVCTSDEILHTINCGISVAPWDGQSGWISSGPPGHTSLANDCQGWDDGTSAALGRVWTFATGTGGSGIETPCNSSVLRFVCCR